MSDAFMAQLGGEWREHPDASGYYFSRDGRAARLLQNGKAKLLIGCSSGQQGYRAISVPKGNGRYRRMYIHRSVCELFNGPGADGLHCRHLDCNQFNNSAANLAWGTPQDNADDGVRNGRVVRGERNPTSKLTRAQVDEMRRIREETGEFYHQIADRFGVSRMTAHRAITGRTWNE